MSIVAKAKEEIKAVGLTTLFFALWFSVFVLLKTLILAEYNIGFAGLSAALVGALIVAKVVLILENVPLATWLRGRSGLVHLVVRTAIYGFGVFVVLLLEKAFEVRHEHGGFVPALARVFQHRDIHHAWATTIGVTGALLVFNALLVVRRHVGKQGLLRMFTSPFPEQARDEA